MSRPVGLWKLVVPLAAAAGLCACARKPSGDPHGQTPWGSWSARLAVDQAAWAPGQSVALTLRTSLPSSIYEGIAASGKPVEKVVALVTAERTFDADGWMRFASDEQMSTLLTPTGIPIEGGVQGPVTNRFGYPFRTPVDELLELPPVSDPVFRVTFTLPADLPPGLYRLRIDLGVRSKTRYLDLNGDTLGTRQAVPKEDYANQKETSYFYSSVFPASGTDATGRAVDAAQLQARIPWTLLGNYNSNGYRGAVADEDRARFGLSSRNLLQDEVVLPLFDSSGKYHVSYSLEPGFPMDALDVRRDLPWVFTQGELAYEITAPGGTRTVQPPTPIRGKAKYGNGPTTDNPAFTQWTPDSYGLYTVKLTGWIADRSGRRYQGGGTYHFYVAKRMTMATATFQGMPYPAAATSSYGRDIAFAPPLPAQVAITATLHPSSDTSQDRVVTSQGTATRGGVFGKAQGLVPLPLDVPGEYEGRILAKYTDGDGHLWVCAMRHAGVVYDPSAANPVVARGKQLNMGNNVYAARGDTGREGYEKDDGTAVLEHLTFPYNPGDVLLIASEGAGTNKIEPVLIYESAGANPAWDSKLNGVGTTNLYIRTSNSYSPHLFPEYITDWEYFYAGAARPGFMPRFLVGESNVRAPYWPTSPNTFGGQIGAGPSGDIPGDLYRLLGGVVMRDAGKAPAYAGYLATAAILPRGTNHNRVIAPGAEDLIGPTGEAARFFLVGFRPGMGVEQGTAAAPAQWRPAVQVDPILPASVSVTLTGPDGAVVGSWGGTAGTDGSWAGTPIAPLATPTAPLPQAGVYRYQLSATWTDPATGQTFTGKMPGLPDAGGEFYVYTNPRPTPVQGLIVDLPNQSTFAPDATLTVTGRSTATAVHYALIMPGAVLDQGTLPVVSGAFQYLVDPAALHARAPIYDIWNAQEAKAQIGRVLHLSLLAEEKAPDGSTFWDFRRVVIRGTTVVSVQQ